MVPDSFLQRLLDLVQKDPETLVRIDVDKQTITMLRTNESQTFDINPYKKECLMNGLDDIDYLLSLKDLIGSFESGKKALR